MDIRESIQAKVEEARRKKQEKPEVCSHEWQKFKETIRPDNAKFKGTAYLVTYACMMCKTKRRSDLIIGL